MTHPLKRLARLLQRQEERITDLEQGRPPDAPEQVVENIQETGIEIGEAEWALDFESDNGEHVAVSDADNLDGFDSFTLAIVVEWERVSDDEQWPIRKRNEGWGLRLGGVNFEGELEFVLWDSGANATRLHELLYPNTNQIYDIIITYDGSEIAGYVDRTENPVTTPFSGTSNAETGDLLIGSGHENYPTVDFMHDGKIHDIVLDNGNVWTDSEKTEYFDTKRLPGTAVTSRWPFSDASGNTLTDVVGTNDGTLQNSPTWVRSDVNLGDTGFTVNATEKTDFISKLDTAGNGLGVSELP